MAEGFAATGGTAGVLELSRAAFSTSLTLYRFCRNTKLVNETVRELATEINSLGNTCAVVHGLLESLEKEYRGKSEGEDGQYTGLWDSVTEQVQKCKRTIDDLDKSLEGMEKDARSFVAQATRHLKLTLKKDEIAGMRSRVKLHMSCLQVTLQSVNIVVSNLAPKRADGELLEKIAALSKDVKSLQKQQPVFSDDIDPSKHWSSTAALRLSQETLTSGRRLDRESIRSGMITRSPTDATTLVELQPSPEALQTRVENDDDPDVAFEIADATAEAAKSAFDRQEWTTTIAYIDELMHGIKRGSFRLGPKPAVDSFDLIHMHAISAYHVEEPAASEAWLLKATEQQAMTESQRSQLSEAQHCLATTSVRLGKLETAIGNCKSALE